MLGVRGPGHYLHGSGGSRAAGPDLEKAGAGGGRLPTLAGGAAPVDDHGFPAKQAHEVSGLLALDHTALRGKRESRSGKGDGSIVLCTHTGLSSEQLAWPRLTPRQAHHAQVCVWSGAGQGTGGAGRLQTALLAEVTPGTASAFPLPQGLAWLRLGLVQEPREPMFANIPLNGSPGMVRGHSSQIVTSASAKKAGRVVRKEPSRSGESPPAEPVQTAAEGLAVGQRGKEVCEAVPSVPALCARVTSDPSCDPCCLNPHHLTCGFGGWGWLMVPSQQEPPLLGQSSDPSSTLLVRIQATCDGTSSACMSDEPLFPTTRL